MTKQIASLLVGTQVASDSGKHIWQLYDCLNKKFGNFFRKGYFGKDANIRKLLNIIEKYHPDDIHYFVVKDCDKIARFIVYFDYKVDNKRFQISFHSFDMELKRYLRKNKNSVASWDHGNSRKNAFILAQHFGWVKPEKEKEVINF